MKLLNLFLSVVLFSISGNVAAAGSGTADDPIVAKNFADIKKAENAGKWVLLNLAGTEVTANVRGDVSIQDKTAALVLSRTAISTKVKRGDRITAGKIKVCLDKHAKSVWVNGRTNDITIVEEIAKTPGKATPVAITTADLGKAENWGRYVVLTGKVTSPDEKRFFIEDNNKSVRIQNNYRAKLETIANDGKTYKVYGLLFSDFFRAMSFKVAE